MFQHVKEFDDTHGRHEPALEREKYIMSIHHDLLIWKEYV